MQTFYLNVKDRARIYIDSVMLFDIFRKANFILVFNFHKFTSCVFVFNKWFQLCNLRQICDPSVTDLICDPISKKWVSMCEETSLCDSVCLIVEFLRHHLIEIFQFLFLKDLCMKLCNTIYRESCNDCHVSHTNLSVHKDCHFADFLFISRIHLTNLDQETTIDLLYNLVNTWKQFREQVDWPFLKCLCHDCMVCISTGLACNFPCIFPA